MGVIGYTLSVPDNGTFMFPEKTDVKRCDVCGYPLDFLAYNPNYAFRKRARDSKLDGYVRRGADVSATYDLYYIVSDYFRDFCLREGYEGLVFESFINDPTHFYLVVNNIVKFDAVGGDVRFEKLCEACGNYESVVGAHPSFLLRSEPLGDEFYRTDLLFGSKDRKRPSVLVGEETKAKLKAAQLKGLTFHPAYGAEKEDA